ncbi:MAG: protein kinase [Acidobacteria bacterium]|nr:protein kinase [Acidobacteriota bacterium]
MTLERWQQIELLYHNAQERAPEDRPAFLEEACAGDEELRREIESLLASHDDADSFIEKAPDDVIAGMIAEEQARSIIGRTLDHYQVRSLLGQGGMGEVYRAHDTRLNRDVAVKILPEHLAGDAEALRRFEREAKAVAALSHPNILSIFDFGTEQGVNYAVMELLEGETLRDRMKHSPLNWRGAVEIGISIAEGLAAAHAKGIIHRDLKPENIFLTTYGQVKILDFGIARVKHVVSANDETLTTAATTRPGTIMGTFGYMSPEQVRGETADAPSDIFSLGCVLYEMVSGKRPFAHTTTAESIAAILKEDPLALTEVNREVPGALAQLINHCLEKKPDDRYQSAHDLAFELRKILSERGALRSVVSSAISRLRPDTPAIRIGAIVVIPLMVLALALYLFSRRETTIDSLAILPVVNASGDANLEYLSDGMTEGLINSLSQLAKLRVMARSTVFSYKGKEIDPRKVGRELNVRAVFTGRVLQSGDNLSVQVDLVDSTDGSQLWGERYNQKLANFTALEAEIARRISEKLRPGLSSKERERLTKHHSEKSEAHLLYLKGRHFWNNWTGKDFNKGLQYFEQALAVDPGYALAWVGLADAYYGLSGVYLPSREMMPKVRAAARRALDIDETLGEAHASLAFATAFYDWDWVAGEREFKRAIELNPGYANAHWGYGLYFINIGRPNEALRELKLAQELDPLSPSIAVTAVWPYYFTPPSARQYDQAVSHLQRIIEVNPNFPPAHSLLGLVYQQKGMFKEALAEAKQARQLDDAPWTLADLGRSYAMGGWKSEAKHVIDELQAPSNQKHIRPCAIAGIYAGLGEKEQAFAWLEKAFDSRDEDVSLISVDPRFDGLRSDPRFSDLVRRMNLAR